MGSLKYIGCPIGLDNREKSHFLPCAAQEVFVLVGAEVAAVTVALHQLEYVVLARHCIDRLLNQVEYTGCFFYGSVIETCYRGTVEVIHLHIFSSCSPSK